MPKPKKKSGFLAKYDRNLTPREFKLFVLFLLAVVAFVFYTIGLNSKSYLPSYSTPTMTKSTPTKTPVPTTKAKVPVYQAK